MSTTSLGVRVRRFAVALALLILGPMALPGGPLNGDRLQALARSFRLPTRRAPLNPTSVKNVSDSRALPSGLVIALTETQQRRAAARGGRRE